MTAVGFEPTPFRNGALSNRLRPLGQTVLEGLKALGEDVGGPDMWRLYGGVDVCHGRMSGSALDRSAKLSWKGLKTVGDDVGGPGMWRLYGGVGVCHGRMSDSCGVRTHALFGMAP